MWMQITLTWFVISLGICVMYSFIEDALRGRLVKKIWGNIAGLSILSTITSVFAFLIAWIWS